MIAAPAAVADDGGFDGIEEREFWILFDFRFATTVTIQESLGLTFSTPANDIIVIGFIGGAGPNRATSTVGPVGSGLMAIIVTISDGGATSFARVVALQP